MIWLFTLMAAFAVRGIEALSVLVIAIIYSVLNRFKMKHRLFRFFRGILLVLASLTIILLAYDIVSAYNELQNHERLLWDYGGISLETVGMDECMNMRFGLPMVTGQTGSNVEE